MIALARAASGLVLAALGGVVLAALSVPLGWMLGALLGGAASANILAPDPASTKSLRRGGQVLIGAATAAALSPDVLGPMAVLLPLMLGYALAANLVGLALSYPFARLTGTDRTTALLSSLPAGMAEMASLAGDLGGRVEVVTLTHTLRVMAVVILVPLVVIGPDAIDPSALAPKSVPGTTPSHWAGLLVAVVGGWALARLATRMGLLNAFVVAPMVAGLALVLLGLPLARMPMVLVILAQILIGYALGARMQFDRLAALPRIALVAFALSGVVIAVTTGLFAPVLARWSDTGNITMVLATAPGGLGEMIAAAKSTGAALGVVAGFQFVRSVVTNMVVPQLLRRHLSVG